MSEGLGQGWTITPVARWEHREERLDGTNLYVRIDTGPDHEEAQLCVDDGEPDCFSLARFGSLSLAELFIAGWRENLAPRLLPEPPKL
jgi:hypothetical protein